MDSTRKHKRWSDLTKNPCKLRLSPPQKPKPPLRTRSGQCPRIIFLNRFFHPDHSATSQIVSDLAFHLASTDKIVHVITSRQLYEEPRAVLASEEVVNGVHIHRLPTTRFGRSSGLADRAIDYSSCYGLMWHRARELAEPGDILVAKTDPPLTSVVAWRVAAQRQARRSTLRIPTRALAKPVGLRRPARPAAAHRSLRPSNSGVPPVITDQRCIATST
jgi:hypothetical protein